MKVHYLEQTTDLSDKNVSERERQINQIFASLFASDEIVQEVEIDGHPYREGYEAEILGRLSEIREIRIHTVHGDVLVQNMLQELAEYLPRLNRAIDSISDLFYGDMTAEDWNLFVQLLEGMGNVQQAVQVIREHNARSGRQDPLMEQLTLFSVRFQELLSELEQAVEHGERVAAGDLIKYELGGIFQQLEQFIQAQVVA